MSAAVYADSSLLVSLYLQDTNTPQAIAAVTKAARPLILTSWQQFEFENACQLRLFRRESSQADLESANNQLTEDIAQGMVIATPLPLAAVLTGARQLTDRHTAHLGCRAFDVYHVAAALHLKATRFLSFDHRQLALARDAGLRTG